MTVHGLEGGGGFSHDTNTAVASHQLKFAAPSRDAVTGVLAVVVGSVEVLEVEAWQQILR